MGYDTEVKINEVIKQYEDGMITYGEYINQLAECVLLQNFFEYIELIPDKIIEEFKNFSSLAHPEDCFTIFGGTLRRPRNKKEERQWEREWEERDRKSREDAYWISKLLREYFLPDAPEPVFEILKLIGQVEDAVNVDNSVVVFGDFQDSFIT